MRNVIIAAMKINHNIKIYTSFPLLLSIPTALLFSLYMNAIIREFNIQDILKYP